MFYFQFKLVNGEIFQLLLIFGYFNVWIFWQNFDIHSISFRKINSFCLMPFIFSSNSGGFFIVSTRLVGVEFSLCSENSWSEHRFCDYFLWRRIGYGRSIVSRRHLIPMRNFWADSTNPLFFRFFCGLCAWAHIFFTQRWVFLFRKLEFSLFLAFFLTSTTIFFHKSCLRKSFFGRISVQTGLPILCTISSDRIKNSFKFYNYLLLAIRFANEMCRLRL